MGLSVNVDGNSVTVTFGGSAQSFTRREPNGVLVQISPNFPHTDTLAAGVYIYTIIDNENQRWSSKATVGDSVELTVGDVIELARDNLNDINSENYRYSDEQMLRAYTAVMQHLIYKKPYMFEGVRSSFINAKITDLFLIENRFANEVAELIGARISSRNEEGTTARGVAIKEALIK